MAAFLWGVLLASVGLGVLLAAIKFWRSGDSVDSSLDLENARWLALLIGLLMLLAGIVLIHRGWGALF